MRLYVSLAVVAILMGVAGLTACNSKESSRSQGGSTASEPSAGTGVASSSSSSSTRSPGAFGNPGTSGSPNPVALTPPGDGAARITPAEVKNELARNNAFIVDVRGEAAYAAGHIKGAILIPATEIAEHTDKLPRNKLIITYCS
jgi:hypothetical protein